jgi:hypothetical protein
MIFALMFLDYTPRSALGIDDGDVRLHKIINIMGTCKFSVHDISRTDPDDENDLPRFNMPFELGMDVGCKSFCATGSQNKKKVYLILDTEKHRFRIYLSDISGQDVKAHNDDPEELIRVIRNWLNASTTRSLPAAKSIVKEYAAFLPQVPRICEQADLDDDDHTFIDYCYIVEYWLNERKGAAK